MDIVEGTEWALRLGLFKLIYAIELTSRKWFYVDLIVFVSVE